MTSKSLAEMSIEELVQKYKLNREQAETASLRSARDRNAYEGGKLSEWDPDAEEYKGDFTRIQREIENEFKRRKINISLWRVWTEE